MSRTSNSTGRTVPTHAVKVISNTWARDSHDLFDFESKHIQSKTFNVQSSTTFVRDVCEVDAHGEGTAAPPSADPLIRVVERGGSFWVDKSASGSVRKLWMVVRDVGPRGHRLAKDDIMKLGRFKFRVRQLVTEQDGEVDPDLGLEDTSMMCQIDGSEDLESKPCRICLMEGPGENDPLIKPCNCKGSIEYVHLKCLRYWTKSRLSLGESPLGSYNYKPLPCELCKTTFPTYMSSGDGARSPLMELPETQRPYIVLESMVRDTRQHSRCLHVMSLAEKALVLGRGHESDLRIADVSISRCHASIHFEEGQFMLQDSESKFGTLVAMRRPRQIEQTMPISVQIGRTVLSFSLALAGEVPAMPAVPQGSVLAQNAGREDDLQRSFRLLFLSRRGRFGAGESGAPDQSGSSGGDEDASAARVRRRISF